MKRVQKQSERAAFYNEGPVVFLYDGSFAESIRESGAEVLEGYDETSADDPALTSLAEHGELLVYELYQDDEVEIEIIVADRLSTDERNRLSAHLRLPTGWIRLPTGRLFLDSYNTLRAGHEDVMDEGATVDLPASDYSVTVYRCDNESDYPHDVLLFRPLKRKPSKARPAILREEFAAPEKAGSGVGYGIVTNGVFEGLIKFISGTDLFAVNMGPEAAGSLGIKAGGDLSFEVAGGELTIPGIYLGDTMNEYHEALPIAEKREESEEELARVTWGARDDFDGLLLIGKRTRRRVEIPDAYFGSWIPVKVSIEAS